MKQLIHRENPFSSYFFFKTAKVLSTKNEIEKVFISSGTTGTESYHHISDLKLYEKSIKLCFDNHYGNSSNYAFLGVTPKPKEKPNSSLIYMIDYLIKIQFTMKVLSVKMQMN